MANESFSFKVGQFNCTAINDSATGNRNCLFINTGQHKVLVETGIGDSMSSPALLLEQLGAAGIPPTAIDLVILSHADSDHIGGTVDASGTLAFPQARHILSQEEWAYWSSNPVRLQPSEFYDEEFRRLGNTVTSMRLPHLCDKLQAIAPETEIVPGIRAIPTPGHTPGHMAIAVTSGEERLLFIGDILYGGDLLNDESDTPKEIGIWTWHPAIDVNPAQAMLTSDRLFAQAPATGRCSCPLSRPGLCCAL